MKSIKRLYLVAFITISAFSLFMATWLIPNESLILVGLLILIPLILLAISYRFITRSRVNLIRKQLYQIIQTLEDFDVDEPKAVVFDDSPFPLFNELNEYLLELIDRIRLNFRANKQFTQNASHELQTPLAIIKGNAEILLQSPNMEEKEMEALGTILQNVNRLSKLNNALILLSKIEHSRFADTTLINFVDIIESTTKNFKDIIRLQAISIEKNYSAIFTHEMSETLAEILFNNLFQNAIRYNDPNRSIIYLQMNEKGCTVSNPGHPPKVPPKKMFKRFRKESALEESLGLGLSIVQSICEQAGLTVTYTYENDLHVLSIRQKYT